MVVMEASASGRTGRRSGDRDGRRQVRAGRQMETFHVQLHLNKINTIFFFFMLLCFVSPQFVHHCALIMTVTNLSTVTSLAPSRVRVIGFLAVS